MRIFFINWPIKSTKELCEHQYISTILPLMRAFIWYRRNWILICSPSRGQFSSPGVNTVLKQTNESSGTWVMCITTFHALVALADGKHGQPSVSVASQLCLSLLSSLMNSNKLIFSSQNEFFFFFLGEGGMWLHFQWLTHRILHLGCELSVCHDNY